ncbi:hypothetical protein GCM10010909_12350 [Acidocella aquatica]|uniref:Cytochrome c domain-containing protein n=1 Tax=Acidocella aquatica TaxID=1922313 RepID=A0ABQ6A5H8_9PROT|nr:cytochrome c [Acidocella aquatica]GLR66555.1 hypothetical protein GCM10010909_12350 [Acidocella aquatica]
MLIQRTPKQKTRGAALPLTALLVCTGLAWPALAQTTAPQTTSSQLATGAKLFAANCASCHRADGSGGMKFGNAVSADLRAPGLETTYKSSDKLLLRAILEAKDEDGDRLDQPMPAWKGRLTTADAEAIIAYLHTLHS